MSNCTKNLSDPLSASNNLKELFMFISDSGMNSVLCVDLQQ